MSGPPLSACAAAAASGSITRQLSFSLSLLCSALGLLPASGTLIPHLDMGGTFGRASRPNPSVIYLEGARRTGHQRASTLLSTFVRFVLLAVPFFSALLEKGTLGASFAKFIVQDTVRGRYLR